MGNQESSSVKKHRHRRNMTISSLGTPPLTDTTRSSTNGTTSPGAAATTTTTPNASERRGLSNRATAGGLSSTRSENTTSSLISGGSSSIRAASLHENLMRCQQRDPMEIYELVSILGEGSMGSVCKVRKRSSAVGGSARPSFVKRQSTKPNDNNNNDCNGNNGSNNNCGGACFSLLGKLHKFLPRRESSIRMITTDHEVLDDVPVPVPVPPPVARPTHRSQNSMISYASSTSFQRREHYYALKSIHLNRCTSKTLQKELRNEVAILRELDHAHIARAIETFELKTNNKGDIDNRMFIVLELCSGGDLYARDPYTEEKAAEIITSVLSAVSYLHSKGIVHRDLKFENIMFVDKRPEAEVKLIDFGLSQKFADDQDHMEDAVGTVYTMAPELLLGNYNSKADVWSVGVIAFMLLSSSMPFYGSTRYQVMKKICKGHVKFSAKRWASVSKHGKALVRHLLESDPTERPSADRALKYIKTWRENLVQEGGQQRTNNNTINNDPAETSIGEASVDQPNPTTTIPENPRKLRWNPTTSSCSLEENVEMMDRIQASIQAFAQYNTLKKLALMVIAYKSTASEIGWLRSTFNRFDLLQNGEISLEEFMEALSETYDYTPAEMETLFCGMDVDGTGSVHYTEFLAATIEAHGSIEEDRIADAFDRIDCDDSGYITIQNLRDFLGDDVPNSYLETIIDDADLVRDHRISYEEFLALWDSNCYETMCQARKEVADRRMKRTQSLMVSFSDGGATSDETDEEEEEEDDKMPELEAVVPVKDPILDKLASTDILQSSAPKTPIIHNTRTHCASSAVECFSQRKALSLRAGWM